MPGDEVLAVANGRCTCGELLTTGGCPNVNCIWHRPAIIFTPVLQGWTCPSCGAGVSPWVSRCPCQPFPVTITHTTGVISVT